MDRLIGNIESQKMENTLVEDVCLYPHILLSLFPSISALDSMTFFSGFHVFLIPSKQLEEEQYASPRHRLVYFSKLQMYG